MPRISDKTSTVLWVVLGACCLAAPAARAELSFGDELVASIPKGYRPEEVIYMPWPSGYRYPRCFALDDKGYIYVPEFHEGIRIHKYDPSGHFIVMLGVEGGGYGVSRIAVAASGETYLLTHASNSGGQMVSKYSPEGELLFQLGPKGVLTQEQLSRGYFINPNAHHDQYFSTGREMMVDKEGNLGLRESFWNTPSSTVYWFDAEGNLLETGKEFPPKIAERLEKHRRQHEALWGSLWGPTSMREKGKHAISEFPGADGHYYYMGYKLVGEYMGAENEGKEVLGFEIRRLTFPEESDSPLTADAAKE